MSDFLLDKEQQAILEDPEMNDFFNSVEKIPLNFKKFADDAPNSLPSGKKCIKEIIQKVKALERIRVNKEEIVTYLNDESLNFVIQLVEETMKKVKDQINNNQGKFSESLQEFQNLKKLMIDNPKMEMLFENMRLNFYMQINRYFDRLFMMVSSQLDTDKFFEDVDEIIRTLEAYPDIFDKDDLKSKKAMVL